MSDRRPCLVLALVGLLCSCGGDAQQSDPRAERESGLNITDASGALARLFMVPGRDPVNWDATTAEQAAKERIDQLLARLEAQGLRCIEIQRDSDTKASISYRSCRRILQFLQIEGDVTVSAEADFSVSPRQLTTSFVVDTLAVHRFALQGRAEFVHHDDGHMGFGLNFEGQAGLSSGDQAVSFQTDGQFAREANQSEDCVSFGALGFIETERVRLTASLSEMEFCGACPRQGTVTIAGAHLQRIEFSEDSAQLIVDDETSTPIPLLCSRR